MWEFETKITTEATPERVWAIWTDVEGWPRWHPGIAQASLESPFAEGARGFSRAPGGPRSELRIGPVEPGRRFVSETILPLTRLRFEHQIEPVKGGGTTITHGVEMSGPATPLLKRVIGPRFEQRMPEALRGLAELALVGDDIRESASAEPRDRVSDRRRAGRCWPDSRGPGGPTSPR